ncbi:glycosyl transferase [Vibrio astriarenae]
MRDMHEIIQFYISRQHYQDLALNSEQPLVCDEPNNCSPLVVSLTTYSERINLVHLTIESISQQSIKPERLVLWLDENEFNEDNLPITIKRQIQRGLEVKFCPNYRSYKKIYPTVTSYPDHNIVTLDDDFIYPFDFIEQLVRESVKYPNAIVGHRTHQISLDKSGDLLPYKRWKKETQDNLSPHLNFVTTGSGTIFPSKVAAALFSEGDVFSQICPSADDVWINFKAIEQQIPRYKVPDNRLFKRRFIHIPDEFSIGLHQENVGQGGNDNQILEVIKHLNLSLENMSKK